QAGDPGRPPREPRGRTRSSGRLYRDGHERRPAVRPGWRSFGVRRGRGLSCRHTAGTTVTPSCHHYPVNRTDRLYGITEELRSAGRHGRTSDWLARRFEVSARTIKRDVSALQQAGVPIWAQPGPGGGYVLDGAASLPPLNFTGSEAVALALALAANPALPLAAEGRTALAKVLAAMTPAEQQRATELAGKVWLRGAAGAT